MSLTVVRVDSDKEFGAAAPVLARDDLENRPLGEFYSATRPPPNGGRLFSPGGFEMALADGPLAYCSNVHPAHDFADLQGRLEQIAVPLANSLDRPLSVGLWLPASALGRIEGDAGVRLRDWMQERLLSTITMNAFPFGDFHARKVKENVYRPDWTEPSRRDYTNRVADLLAVLLPEGGEGSVSTLPCAYRRLSPDAKPADFFPMFLECVQHLARLYDATGKTVRLSIEPEPGCFLERTGEAASFIHQLREFAGARSAEESRRVQTHLGLCFDVCHSAVMFESPTESLRKLTELEIRVGKIQVSSALELRAPPDRAARKFLAQFVEERYLHQVTGMADGRFLFADDLSTSLALMPTDEWKACEAWRIHFHVPIHKKEIGPLQTTTWAVDESLAAAEELPYAPDLEVETYTWDVLPAISRTGSEGLVEGLAAELRHAQAIIDRLRS